MALLRLYLRHIELRFDDIALMLSGLFCNFICDIIGLDYLCHHTRVEGFPISNNIGASTFAVGKCAGSFLSQFTPKLPGCAYGAPVFRYATAKTELCTLCASLCLLRGAQRLWLRRAGKGGRRGCECKSSLGALSKMFVSVLFLKSILIKKIACEAISPRSSLGERRSFLLSVANAML